MCARENFFQKTMALPIKKIFNYHGHTCFVRWMSQTHILLEEKDKCTIGLNIFYNFFYRKYDRVCKQLLNKKYFL